MSVGAPRRPRRAPGGARRARAARRHQGSDLAGRVLAAIPAAIYALAIVELGGLGFAIGIILPGLVCLHELYTMLARTKPVKLAGFLALIALVLAARWGDQFQVLLVLVAAVPLTFGLLMLRPRVADVTPPLAVTLLGVVWIGLPLAHGMLLRDLPHGDGVVIDVLVGTFVGDAGAYFVGRALGRRPLTPRISPHKTVEGLVGGMVIGTAAVWFAGLYQDWLAGWEALVLGAAVALAAPVGDLFESAVKRGAGTKDTGRAFGAHGGALDRLDAVLFTAVAGYYVWAALL